MDKIIGKAGKGSFAKILVAFALAATAVFAVGLLNHPGSAWAATPDQQITVSVEGADVNQTFTYQQLSDLGAINTTDKAGYLYRKPITDLGQWNLVGASNYVTLNDLLTLAGASNYWTPGATIQFKTADYPDGYTKYYATFEETERDNFFYTAVGASGLAPLQSRVAVPTVIAFDSGSSAIAEGSTSQATLDGMQLQARTRFCCGLDDTTVNGTGPVNMGKRYPSDVTEIVIRQAA